eukprot:CAMPEP_0167752420 /NCGR_PEP_ID=MMETSP0110_2-20121227/7130_1 /TAXON_ID=629695 /ORGANISM="Gymnochlora sp., Strain CCMP2014" /LENGTH=577 /DNA_ID=CAMNT_0007638037 /DNA_START=155 /DNA_END=1888 /DNA_ORIENTATION=+
MADKLFRPSGRKAGVENFARQTSPSAWQWLDEEDDDEDIEVPKENATLLRMYVDDLLQDSELFNGFEKKKGRFKSVYDLEIPEGEDEYEYFDEEDDEFMFNDNRVRRSAPKEARYFDAVKVYVRAGSGGDGCVAFETLQRGRKKTATGGSGGNGGSIYLRVDEAENTLRNFRSSVHFVADRGAHGEGKHKNGKDGKDIYIDVPPGTLVYEADELLPDQRGKMLGDLINHGDTMLVAQGGDGGLGNHYLKPVKGIFTQYAEAGEKGKEKWLLLELKLVADIGIVGVPSAGKSTLLNSMTNGRAQTKVGAYPFTTLAPNLGVVSHKYDSIVVADIPGLLEGAHQGTGLGIEFLRHVERCRALAHLLSGDRPDPLYDFEAIQQELELFSPYMLDKPQVVVFNKMDLPEAQEMWPKVQKHFEEKGVPVLSITAAQGLSDEVRDLIQQLVELDTKEKNRIQLEEEIAKAKGQISERERKRLEANKLRTTVKPFEIEKLDRKIYKVASPKIEKLAQMTKWEYRDAVERFETVMRTMGVYKALKKQGVKEGDLVLIGDEEELVWSDSLDTPNVVKVPTRLPYEG